MDADVVEYEHEEVVKQAGKMNQRVRERTCRDRIQLSGSSHQLAEHQNIEMTAHSLNFFVCAATADEGQQRGSCIAVAEPGLSFTLPNAT